MSRDMNEDRLSFTRLKNDVIAKDICAMCYGCVSFCSANELNVLTIKEDKPAYHEKSNCLKCGICHLICPRTTDLDIALKTRFNFRQPIGLYEQTRARQSSIRFSHADK